MPRRFTVVRPTKGDSPVMRIEAILGKRRPWVSPSAWPGRKGFANQLDKGKAVRVKVIVPKGGDDLNAPAARSRVARFSAISHAPFLSQRWHLTSQYGADFEVGVRPSHRPNDYAAVISFGWGGALVIRGTAASKFSLLPYSQ